MSGLQLLGQSLSCCGPGKDLAFLPYKLPKKTIAERSFTGC